MCKYACFFAFSWQHALTNQNKYIFKPIRGKIKAKPTNLARIFMPLTLVEIFPGLWTCSFFSALEWVSCFPALSAGSMFSRACWHWLHFCSHLAPITYCFVLKVVIPLGSFVSGVLWHSNLGFSFILQHILILSSCRTSNLLVRRQGCFMLPSSSGKHHGWRHCLLQSFSVPSAVHSV